MGDSSWARSYRRNQGTLTKAQRRALRDGWSNVGVDLPYGAKLDVVEVFGREAKCVLEVGFGMGENLVAMAADRPEVDFVGVEVHRPGLGSAVAQVIEQGLENVRIVRHDVFEFLKSHVEGRAFDEVMLFFPEPWPGDASGERRIVRPLLLEVLEPHLREGAVFHLASDVEDYAAHIGGVFAGTDWVADGTPYVERPAWRPMTKYEAKGLSEGRSVFDLRFVRGGDLEPEAVTM